MKIVWTVKVILFGFMAAFLVGCANTQTSTSSQGDYSAASILTITNKLDEILISVANLADNKSIKLTKATIDLKTVATDESGGGFGVLVFKTGASQKEVLTSSIKVELTEFKSDLGKLTGLNDGLVAFTAALNDIVENSGKYKVANLGTSGITATLNFVVEQKVEGSAEIEIKPVNLSLSGSSTTENTHSITLEFKKK